MPAPARERARKSKKINICSPIVACAQAKQGEWGINSSTCQSLVSTQSVKMSLLTYCTLVDMKSPAASSHECLRARSAGTRLTKFGGRPL